ncbi:TonB-dependent copper receptor [Halomonas caseinilytica]|uniref:TonB-dependent copper receptor n=1 Tax=Halomonas caseinilytica TaxID=438744 RepID=UPI00084841B6|nr:TonB-dependent copper receptor [Halomonas caseinilytica]
MFTITHGPRLSAAQAVSPCRSLPSRTALTAAVALTSAAFAAPGLAQTMIHDYTSSSIQHDTMVVTAVPLSSPITVETDPRTPRQPMPASDGADYLKTIPGFTSVRNGGTNGDPVFRGMFGSRLKVLTNGSEMLGACPSRMDAPTSYILPEAYDSLTVIKGPQSVLWGPGASAATVRFDRGPEAFDDPGARVDGSVILGTHGRFDRRIDAAAGNEDAYVRLIGNESEANDYKDGNGDAVPSRWDKWNGDVALGLTPDPDTWLEITAGRGNGEARYAGRGMDGSKFLRETAGIRFEKKNLSEHWRKLEMQANYAYADHIMDNFSLRDPAPMGMDDGGMGMGHDGMAMRLDRRTRSTRVASTWAWYDFQWIVGVDAQQQIHRNRDGGHWESDYEQIQYGLFNQLTWFASDHDRVIGGLRVDGYHVDDKNNDTVTAGDTRRKTLPGGFIRFEQDLADAPATWYAGVGHAQRFPDYWELKPGLDGPGDSLNAFDGVEPEKTTQLDMGVQYQSERTRAWVSGYVGYVQDFILFDYNGDNTQVNNIDAQIAGAEMGAAYDLTDNWTGEVNLAYAWGRNATDGEALPQIPPLESRLSLTYERDVWSVGGLWRLVAPQNRIALNKGNVVGQDLGSSAGFGIFSFNGAYRFSPNFTLSTGIDNVFDNTYSEHLNLAGNAGFGYSGDTRVNDPGRMVWAKLDFHF